MTETVPSHATGASSIAMPERAWSRASWFVVMLSLSLLLISGAQKAYRMTLPTDGWLPLVGTDDLIFDQNVFGLPSPIQRGDDLLAVNGRDVTDWRRRGLLGQLSLPPGWQAGNTVHYTVRRNGQVLDLAVPLYHWDTRLIGSYTLRLVIDMVPLLALTLFVFLKRPRDRAAQILLVFGAITGLQLLNFFDGMSPGLETPFASPLLYWIATVCTDNSNGLILPLLSLYLALTFPVLNPLMRRFARPIVAAMILMPVGFYVLYLQHLSDFVGLLWFLLYPIAELAAVIYNLVTVRDPLVRAQVGWVSLGYVYIIVTLYMTVLSFAGIVPRAWDDWLLPFADLVFTVALAIAILRYRLFAIDIILNRALVYGALTACVIGVYVGIVSYLSTLFPAQNGLVSPLIATGFVAVLFQPLRERLQRGVNRLLYGERDEPYAVLTRLGQRLEGTLAVDDLLSTIAETVVRALKVPLAALYVQHGGELMLAAEYAAERPASAANPPLPPARVALPLVAQGETVGELRLALRPGESAFSSADQRLLNDLTRQAGIAVQAARLTTDLRQLTVDLQQSRERLVTTREEERRRLRRDLHDGLGPALASLTFKIDAARNLLRRDVAKADTLLASVADQMQATIADIRRLVYDLRPPALDQLGLVAALRQYVTQLNTSTQITVEASDDLTTLPAAVEVAAYRIALEAITNVLRHAKAAQCVVVLTIDQSALILEVRDNGQGLPSQHHAGVGLRSMHERAAELGGVCTIEPLPGGGTVVRARLPLLQAIGDRR